MFTHSSEGGGAQPGQHGPGRVLRHQAVPVNQREPGTSQEPPLWFRHGAPQPAGSSAQPGRVFREGSGPEDDFGSRGRLRVQKTTSGLEDDFGSRG